MLVSPSPFDSSTRFHLRGEVDLVNAAMVTRELERVVETTTDSLVVDCAELDFIDSSGISALVGINQQLREHRRAMRLVNLQTGPRRVFVVLGLEAMFDLTERAHGSA
jgi:anti-sigma B factor antagonist